MKTSIKTVAGKRFVVVDTEIAKDAYRADITKLNVVTDKEFGTEFVMTVDMDAPVGKVSGFGVTVNGVTDDGNFAAVIPVAEDATIEDIKKEIGAKLVAASKGAELLKAQMESEATAVDAICEGLGTDAE